MFSTNHVKFSSPKKRSRKAEAEPRFLVDLSVHKTGKQHRKGKRPEPVSYSSINSCATGVLFNVFLSTRIHKNYLCRVWGKKETVAGFWFGSGSL